MRVSALFESVLDEMRFVNASFFGVDEINSFNINTSLLRVYFRSSGCCMSSDYDVLKSHLVICDKSRFVGPVKCCSLDEITGCAL